MKMYIKTITRLTALCCFLFCLFVGKSTAYASTKPYFPSDKDFPKPSITANQKDISYVILLNSFGGTRTDRTGYWSVLINDEYSTLCNVGDKIQVIFNEAERPDKIIMRYNPNTLYNPDRMETRYFISEYLEIDDGFVIKEEHLNPKNKDVMYYLTATWENGDSLEYAFLILTEKSIVPIRETHGEVVYVDLPPRPQGTITMSGLTINEPRAIQPPQPITVRITGGTVTKIEPFTPKIKNETIPDKSHSAIELFSRFMLELLK